MEWSFDTNVAVLEIDLKARKGEWVSFERATREEIQLILDLDDREAWARLGELVQRTFGVYE